MWAKNVCVLDVMINDTQTRFSTAQHDSSDWVIFAFNFEKKMFHPISWQFFPFIFNMPIDFQMVSTEDFPDGFVKQTIWCVRLS